MTLIELMVILAVMAVVATVAVTSTSSLTSQTQYDTTSATLQHIQEAVLGPANLREPDGRNALVRGFVADMGRVPKAILDPNHYGVLTLEELVTAGANSLWSPRQLTSTNVCPNCTNAFDVDSTVVVATGWRGPYLRLPSGASDITDGWNHRLTTGAAGVPPHLFKYVGPGQTAVTSAGDPINGVAAYGIDDASGGADYNQDSSVEFNPADYASIIIGSLTVVTNGSFFKNDSNIRSYNPLYVRVYGPDGGDGSKLRCESVIINVNTNTYTTNYTLSGLLQGPKVIRAAITNSTSSPSKRFSGQINVMLGPGTNTINLILDKAT